MTNRFAFLIRLCNVLAASCLVAIFQSPAVGQDSTPIAWIKSNAIPIDTVEAGHGFADLQPLKAVIGDARIVSLGESTHGSREIFQMKHRLVEFLASELGFTIFSIEANMPEAYRVNEYVLNGSGDPKRLIRGMYFWAWTTDEVLDMVQWMRRFNAEKRGHIEFTGFDMQTPDVAMQEVLRFLRKADETRVAETERVYTQASQARPIGQTQFAVATGSFPIDVARGKRVKFAGWIRTENVRDGFAGLWWRTDGPEGKVLSFDNMAAQQVTGSRDWQQFSIELDVPNETTNINFGAIMPGKGRAWFDGLAVSLDGKPYQNQDLFDFDFEGPAAANVAWILKQNPDAKIVLWAHNGHIAKQPMAMGSYLDETFGSKHLAIGFATGSGEYQAMGNGGLGVHPLKAPPAGSVESLFGQAGIPRFLIDLRRTASDPAAASWFGQPRPFRSIGAVAVDSQFYPMNLPKVFDALIYLDQTSRARPIVQN